MTYLTQRGARGDKRLRRNQGKEECAALYESRKVLHGGGGSGTISPIAVLFAGLLVVLTPPLLLSLIPFAGGKKAFTVVSHRLFLPCT